MTAYLTEKLEDLLDHPVVSQAKVHLAKQIFQGNKELRFKFYKLLMTYLGKQTVDEALALIHMRYSNSDEDEVVVSAQHLRQGWHTVSIAITEWLRAIDLHSSTLPEAMKGWATEIELAILEVASEDVDGMKHAFSLIVDQSNEASSLIPKFFTKARGGLAGFAFTLALYIMLANNSQFDSLLRTIRGRNLGSEDIKNFLTTLDFISDYAIPILVVVGILFAGVYGTLNFLTGPIRDWLDRKIIFYRLFAQVQSATFLQLYAVLLKAGDADLDAMQRVQRLMAVKNRWLNDKLETAYQIIESQGHTMPRAFQLADNGFPDRVTKIDLRAYSEQENWVDELPTIADRSVQNAVGWAENLGQLTNGLTILISSYLVLQMAVFAVTFNQGLAP